MPGHERLGEGIRARSVAHLQWHVLGAAAYLRRRVLATSGVAAAEHDHTEEAAVHEALRDVVANSLVGAGHHGDASGGDHPLAAIVRTCSAPCWPASSANGRSLKETLGEGNFYRVRIRCLLFPIGTVFLWRRRVLVLVFVCLWPEEW